MEIPKLGPEALVFAEELIEKIDLEGKYIADAQYELEGKKLKQYLAFAYSEGMRKGLERRKG
jgi:hypothetical protein